MSPLHELQQDFQRFLLGDESSIESRVVGTARASAGARLGVYGNAYVSRLTEALEANFPGVAKLLGTADFAALCEAYVRAHPSGYSSVRYYGETLADFIAAHPDYESAPILAELARWDWMMAEVFDAADQSSLNVDAMQTVQPEEWATLCFDWHPSVRRIALAWNVPEVWSALEEASERPRVEVSSSPLEWLAWRRDLRCRYRSLSKIESLALDASREGKTFGDVCELMWDECEDEAPARAAAFLKDWLSAGLIVGLTS